MCYEVIFIAGFLPRALPEIKQRYELILFDTINNTRAPLSSHRGLTAMNGIVESFALGQAQDYATDKWNTWAGEKLQTKDPYRYEDAEGKSHKLKLPAQASKQDQKMWKWVQRRAWLDDKCFCGCYPVDCGVGLGPLMAILPVIGPILMYAVHARLVTRAGQYWHLDSKTIAKMQANILFDFLISLPPVIGSLLVWLNGCSTRNAAIVHTQVSKRLMQQQPSQPIREVV